MHIQSQSWGRFVVRAVILFIVIAAGVFVGIYVATATGITDKINLRPSTPANMDNQTRLELNQLWPLVAAADTSGRPVILDTAISGRKTVVAFVAVGCDACRLFLDKFAEAGTESNKAFQLVLLAQNPAYFIERYDGRAFRVTQEVLDEHSVHAFPTIVGINEQGSVVFVSSGFTPNLTIAFVKKYL